MRSMVHALTWDYLRYAGGLILALWALSFSPLLILASLKPLGIQRGDPVMLILELSLLPFIIFMLMLSAATGLATTRNLTTKPISNLSLASWRIGSGTVILSIQLGLVVWCTNAIFDAGWPLLGAVLFTIATWVTAQPFICLGTRSLSKMVLTGLPLVAMCMWYIARYKTFQANGIVYDWNELSTSEALQLLSVIVLFSLLTLWCVALDRCGDSSRPTRLHARLRRALSRWWDSGTALRKPYTSPQQAYFWFEWHTKGWMMPAALALLMCIILTGNWLEGNSMLDLQQGLLRSTFLLPIMGVGVGGSIGCNLHAIRLQADSGRSDQVYVSGLDAMSSFQATRPLSDLQIARTLLKICASNMLLSLAVWILIAGPVLAYGWSVGQPLGINFQNDGFALLVPVLTWTAMSNVMTMTSTGRGPQIAGWLGSCFVGFCIIEIVFRWLNMLRLMEMLEWATLITFAACTVGLTAWYYLRAHQGGLLRLSHIMIATMIVISLMALVLRYSPSVNIAGVLCLICLSLLSVLPWASTPLAVHWNRHR